jgi:hypothetical protein
MACSRAGIWSPVAQRRVAETPILISSRGTLRLREFPLSRSPLPHERRRRESQTQDQGQRDAGGPDGGGLVPARHFLEPVKLTGRPGENRLILEMPFQVGGESVGRLVTPRAVLLQTLHHDPVEVALEQRDRLLNS